tara:strand:- start:1444 stop:2022 length:579 start_codon:yes stop_codon:yes gene_type:complete
MRDDLFAIPVRKYNVDNNQQFIDYVSNIWKEERLRVPSPFLFSVREFGYNLTQIYTDLLEQFLTDIECFDTHSITMDAIILKVLEKGESTDRFDTLPSHYTLIHYVDVVDGGASDTLHHPARQPMNAFKPAHIDEWQDAAGLYINKGDAIIYPSFMEHSSPVQKETRMTITVPLILKLNEQGRESNIKEPTA